MVNKVYLTTLCASLWIGPSVLAQSVASNETTDASHRTLGTVTIHADAIPLKSALQQIAHQAGLMAYYSDDVTESLIKVTLRLTNASAQDAFDQALRGTSLRAAITAKTVVFERDGRGHSAAIATGTITGTVTSATTKTPLRGAMITLDNASRGVQTDDNGAFRLTGVPVGEHLLVVRMLGHLKQKKTVAVKDGETLTLGLVLEPSVNALDQVVVTGTVVATELKAVPNAITVITAKDLEQRGITRIDQLFRGDVPGLFVLNNGTSAKLGKVTMFSRGVTALSDKSAGTNQGTNPIKTYLDGVELADPSYLSQIDPATIARIEILSGPQASTIYGANALNGVMQIFTKRGTTSAPQLVVTVKSGLMQNNINSAFTPQHDDAVSVSGIEGRIAYNVGGGWNHMGAWTPENRSTRISASGGAHIDLPTTFGGVGADVSVRRDNTTQHENGSGAIDMRNDGMFNALPRNSPRSLNRLTGQTLGFQISYTPTQWWSHRLEVGRDAASTEQRQLAQRYNSPSDTTLFYSPTTTEKHTLAYASTIQVPIAAWAKMSLVLGADAVQTLATSLAIYPTQTKGNLTGFTLVSRQPNHNTGGFVQAQLGVFDGLFLTYGLRADWNPNFGAEANPNLAPRYGAAYTRDVGPVTMKLRGSYGRSIRPPAVDMKLSGDPIGNDPEYVRVWGPINQRIANPLLGPENKQGGEGGIELYFGNRASLVVTRFNETVNNLIEAVAGADSVRSVRANPAPIAGWITCQLYIQVHSYTGCSSQDADGYWYRWVSQNMNVANIRDQGWEVQGSVTAGPFTTRGTYSWTKSRSLGATEALRSRFALGTVTAAETRKYTPGATFSLVAEHTWALGVTYALARTMMSLNLTGIGQVHAGVNALDAEHLSNSLRLPNDRWRVSPKPFWLSAALPFPNAGYALADFTASHRFSTSVEGLLEIQNLGNYYTNDQDARAVVLGRQTKVGVRIRR